MLANEQCERSLGRRPVGHLVQSDTLSLDHFTVTSISGGSRQQQGSGVDTGRVDPRVGSGRVGPGRVRNLGKFGGSGRVGSKYLKCIIFSLSVELSKFSCNSQH